MPLITEAELMESLLREAAGRRTNEAGFPPAGLDNAAGDDAWWRALDRRRSVREFGTEAVSAAELTAVLGALPPLHGPGGQLSVAVAVAPGHGPEAGVHLISPAGCWQRIGDDTDAETLRTQYAPAPVHLFLLGAGDEPGAHWPLLVRAGAAGHGCWLAALTLGLDGCPFGRSSALVTGLARTAGHTGRHLFTIALGRPVAPAGARARGGRGADG